MATLQATPLAVFPHDYIAPICASFMDPQKVQLDWWYCLQSKLQRSCSSGTKKIFSSKLKFPSYFRVYTFPKVKSLPKKKTRQNSPPKNGRVLGEFLASRRVFFTRLHSMPRGYDSSHFLRTENSFGIIWSSPRQLRVKNTLRVGHRGPVGRKTTQKPPQNTKKWKKIVKKRLFSRFGHFGQNSDFSRKKSKTGIFFDITKPPLAQIYPKSGL